MFLLLHDGLSILIPQHFTGSRVNRFHLSYVLIGTRSKYANPFFSLLHLTFQTLPGLITGHPSGIGSLQIYEDGVIKTVGMEFLHRGKVGFVFLGSEHLFDSLFQLIRKDLDLFLPFFTALWVIPLLLSLHEHRLPMETAFHLP